jgi:hypothetical protein
MQGREGQRIRRKQKSLRVFLGAAAVTRRAANGGFASGKVGRFADRFILDAINRNGTEITPSILVEARQHGPAKAVKADDGYAAAIVSHLPSVTQTNTECVTLALVVLELSAKGRIGGQRHCLFRQVSGSIVGRNIGLNLMHARRQRQLMQVTYCPAAGKQGGQQADAQVCIKADIIITRRDPLPPAPGPTLLLTLVTRPCF